MKKVGKTTRPFRYDLNQIPYNSIVEVTNRIRSSRQSAKELWMGVLNTVQEAMTKIIPKKKKCKKAKWLSEEALQIAEERREVKSKRNGERYTQLNAEFQRIAKRDKKPSSMNNAKKQRKTTEWGRLEISSRKLKISKKYFMQGWA